MNDKIRNFEKAMDDIRRSDEFWQWVLTLETTDDPRGDFIQDTKDIKKMGCDNFNDRFVQHSCYEARVECENLILEFVRDFDPDFSESV